MNGEVTGGQVRDQCPHDVADDGDQGAVQDRNHVAECLQGVQIHLAVPISQSRAESIKHLM